ncbi:hypothetical protein [Bacillus weihaiensis]|uniref:hypothetical protein n=1 Tax=Bacillus weihaiensis TaxID=1547283 RepID=UPI00235673FF|nr:hypothetical protein [Bacillus weihaiensis]
MKVKHIIISTLTLGIIGSAIISSDILNVAANTSNNNEIKKEKIEDKVIISEKKDKVYSAHNASAKGLEAIKQNATFKVVAPDEDPTKRVLKGAFMTNAKDNSSERHVDFFYSTPSGEIHIWQTNINPEEAEKNPLSAPGYNEEIIKIKNHEWSFTSHQDEKDLLIFTTKVEDKIVQVSGKVPYEEIIEVISSLK